MTPLAFEDPGARQDFVDEHGVTNAAGIAKEFSDAVGWLVVCAFGVGGFSRDFAADVCLNVLIDVLVDGVVDGGIEVGANVIRNVVFDVLSDAGT